MVAPTDITLLEDTVIKGWLLKKSKKGFFSTFWRRMFVVVEQDYLRYYLSEDVSTQKGVINFRAFKAELLKSDAATFQIRIPIVDGNSKVFDFRVSEEQTLP